MLGPTLWKGSFGQSHFRGQPNSMSSMIKVRRKIWAFPKPQCPSPWVIGTCPFAMEWAAQPFSGHTELLSQILLPIKATLMFQWQFSYLPQGQNKNLNTYYACLSHRSWDNVSFPWKMIRSVAVSIGLSKGRVRFPVPGVLNLNPAYITCELKLEITKCTQTRKARTCSLQDCPRKLIIGN